MTFTLIIGTVPNAANSQIVDLGSFACQLSFTIFWVSLERMNLQAVGSFGANTCWMKT
jgi:hypothetical protein